VIKQVVLIEPKAPERHVFSRWKLPRLGLVILATRLKQAGYDVKVFIEEVAPVDFDALFSADLVGVSTTTSTAPRAYEFARAARRAGIPVVMGGSHVTFMADESLEHCDYVLRGEADDLIVEFVRRLGAGEDLETMPSLSRRVGGRVVHNPPPGGCVDVETLPEPDFGLIHGYTESLTAATVLPVQTSRGCPFDCNFCSVTRMFGRSYRFQSTEKVMVQLRRLRGRRLFFYDDNFTANRARAKELCRAMIREKLDLDWSAQVRCDAASDPELLDLMAKAGCFYVYVGIESASPAALEGFNKHQSVGDIERAIREFRRRGIRIHGMFIFGADEDTPETLRETVRFARRQGIASAQFMILVPLPGTPVFSQMEREGRILSRDWSLYDAHHVVFRPKRMSPLELQVEAIKAFGAFYTLGSAIRRLVRFDWFTLIVKLWGYSISRERLRRLHDYVEATRRRAEAAGRRAEVRARQTADDIKIAIARFDLDGLRRRRRAH
jgi:radical SAM superfamily enzyme YgiQ (UPF0313 family)